MKYILTGLISIMIAVPAYAKPLKLFVENRSDQTMRVVYGYNNETISMAPHSRVENVKFDYDSVATNFIDGNFACNWHIKSHSKDGGKLQGIGYIKVLDKFECVLFVG